MANAFVVEVFGRTAGILSRERDSFRFSASTPAMNVLDGQLFKSQRDAELATEKVAAVTLARLPDKQPAVSRALY
jgi:hypothetical protein